MAPATPSKTLPKSKATATGASVDPVSAAASLSDANSELARLREQHTDNPDFTHPDHVIPPLDYAPFDHLIIVCCHAIFHADVSTPDFPLHSPHDERNWHLAPFQKSISETGKPGEHETFLAHVLAGVDGLTTGPHANSSLLVLSGGATKQSLTPLSEARSYYHAALAEELAQGHRGGGRTHKLYTSERILLEEHATDSFQNLLFSILLFRQTTGRYPRHIRIITHAFKAKRFLDLHARALRWPRDRLQVQGIDPIMSSLEHEDTIRGEQRFGYEPWVLDPLGTGGVLSAKREQRGWSQDVSRELANGLEPGVVRLLEGNLDGVVLPWEQESAAGKPDSLV